MMWVIILALIHIPVSEAATSTPIVTFIKGAETLDTGTDLQLNCSVSFDDGEDETSYVWYFNNEAISDETSATLIFLAVEKDQAGQYSCSVTSNTTKLSLAVVIIVNYLDNVHLQLSSASPFNEGDTVSFTCSVTSNVEIEYEFKNETATVRERSSSSTYNILKARESDTGSYTCTTFASSLNVTSNPVNIKVQELFQKPTLTTNSNLKSGGNFLLQCIVSDSLSSPTLNITYSFFKENTSLLISTAAAFNKTAQSTDTGEYTCAAEANGILKKSDPVDVTVSLKVVMTILPTIEGQNLTITCNVEGGENASLSWKRNNIALSDTSDTIQVLETNRSMIDDVYNCSATSSITSAVVTERVTKDHIFWLDKPTVTFQDDNAIFKENDALVLNCITDSNPSPLSNVWYKNDTVVSGEVMQQYMFNAEIWSEGNYSCGAANDKITSQKKSIPVVIWILYIDQPSIKITEGTAPFVEGQNISMTCEVHEYHVKMTLTYQWLKDAVLLKGKTSRTLRLTSLSESNTGTYTCEVTGTYNDTSLKKKSQSQQITVNVKPKVSINIQPVIEGQNLTITCSVQSEELVQSYSWGKNGTGLGINVSSVLVPKSTRSMIGDTYSCIASSSVTRSDEVKKTVTKDHIFWLDKPIISATGDKTVQEGVENITLHCTTESNPAPSYKWYKNETEVSNQVSSQFQFTANKDAAGNYSCSTTNTEITTEIMSISIDVIILYLEQPNITFINNTSSPVIEEKNVVMNCQLRAHHSKLSLTYEWLKTTNGSTVSVGMNKTLSLRSVTKDDAGTYICEVIGKYQSVSITNSTSKAVEVHYKASGIGTSPSDTEIQVGQRVALICNASEYGNPKARLSWYRRGELLVNGEEGNQVEYFLNVDRNSTGDYICKAFNLAGEIEASSSVVATDKPDQPTSLKLSSTTSTSLEVTWQPPLCDGNKNITHYVLLYKKNGDTNFVSKNVTDSITYNITDLTPAVMYQIKVQAVNVIGKGKFSEVLQVITGEALPTAPQNFGYEKIFQAEEITLTWEKPYPSHGYITNYTVCHLQDTSDGEKVRSSVEQCITVGNITEVSLVKLGFYNGYNVSVSARNSAGYGPKATINQIVTMEGEPTAVRNIILLSYQESINVTWSKPENIYGKLHGYVVTYHLESENAPKSVNECRNITKLSCSIKNLTPFRDYKVIVTIFNTLYSKSGNKSTKTRGAAPPRFNGTLPIPPSDMVEEKSFGINIVKFDENNGEIESYYVFAMKKTNSLYQSSTHSLTNDQIKDFAVGRLKIVTSNHLFIVGSGETSKRKRRALPTPNNPELEEDTAYVVFVRAYVDDDTYQSTDWYAPVTTDKAMPNLGVLIGIIIGILIVICFVVVIVALLGARKKNEDDIELRENALTDRDPTIPVELDGFEEHVNFLKADSYYEYSQEYAMISRELVHPYSHKDDNTTKNRYFNIPAYDHTRVSLSLLDDDPSTEYINANYIEGFDRENEYIAAQGPLPETIFDFWRMAWECEVVTIVMLTRLQEDNRIKCAQYWPDNGSLSLKDIIITITDAQDFPDHVVRTFHVTRTGQAVERVIKQFHFTSWPDFGVPKDPSALLAFLQKVNNWKGISQCPVIVHCSAGVGRTGTYITIDTQIKNIKKNKQITVFTNVTDIRQQRCLMVQSEAQYIFIHNALSDYLDSGDTEVNANALNDYIKTLSEADERTGMTGFMDQFVKLAKANLTEQFTEGNKNVNQAKNRYKTVYPYDSTRVKLLPRPGVDGSDYINANYIDSYTAKNYFIATQAPLESTVGDFWRMVWERKSGTIVMLSNETERGQVRAHPYWPQDSSLKIDQFIVELVSVTTYGDHVVRALKLTNTDASTSREVKQFQYTTWPENGSPDTGTGLIELIGQVQKWNSSISDKIITVHCSAGVGRTGVFIALTNLIERIKTEAVVDVYQTIKKMRRQRTAMVQTKDQYEFCFKTLQEYLNSFDLYANFR